MLARRAPAPVPPLPPVDDRGRQGHATEPGDNGLVRQSSLTSAAAAISLLSGLLLDVVVATRFGAGAATDAWFIGARVPLAVCALLLVSANQALVPSISTWLNLDGERRTARRTSELMMLAALAGAGVAAVIVALAPYVVTVTAPGASAATRDTATDVLRIVALGLPLTAVSEVLRSALNARYSFVAPALVNLVLNTVAAATVLLVVTDDVRIVAVAWLAGAVARTAYLLVWAAHRRCKVTLLLGRPSPEAIAAVRLCARPMTSAGLLPLVRLVEQMAASYLPAGSISILNYAQRIVAGAGGAVFFRSIIVALVPRLTAATTRSDDDAVRRISGQGIRLMLLVSLPLAAVVAALAEPVAALLLGRSSDAEAKVALLAAVLVVGVLAVPADALQRALLAPFFSRLDTRSPFRNVLLGAGTNLAVLPLVLLLLDGRDALLGIMAAYVLASWLQVAHAGRLLRRAGIRPAVGSWQLLLQLLATVAVSVLVIRLVLAVLPAGGTGALDALRLAVAGASGLLVVGAVLLVVRLRSRTAYSTADPGGSS